jgi:hypothetical protein
MKVANSLAYYDKAALTAVKSFIMQDLHVSARKWQEDLTSNIRLGQKLPFTNTSFLLKSLLSSNPEVKVILFLNAAVYFSKITFLITNKSLIKTVLSKADIHIDINER